MPIVWIAIAVLLALFVLKIAWNVLALVDAALRERSLSLMPVEPAFLVLAAILALWAGSTPWFAIGVLVVGALGIAGSYWGGVWIGKLLRKRRRRE